MIENPTFIISIQSKRLHRIDVTLFKSQDSEESCFFIYSIYWCKDSSLLDVSKCDIWSQVSHDVETRAGGEAVRHAGALLSPPGGCCPKVAAELRHPPANTPGCKKARRRGRWWLHSATPPDGPMNYWPGLLLLIHAVLCTFLPVRDTLTTHTRSSASSCTIPAQGGALRWASS